MTGATTTLAALGSDDGGESDLKYLWRPVDTTPAPVTFSDNGDNSAKTVTATFTAPGTYRFAVSAVDAGGLWSQPSYVTVTVDSTLTSLVVSPTGVTVPLSTDAQSSTQQFSASAVDQFGNAIGDPDAIQWSCQGDGTIDGAGLYTSPASGTVATVTASDGTRTATATVNLRGQPFASQAIPQPVVGYPWQYAAAPAYPGDPFTYAFVGTPPTGMTINPSTGVISWPSPLAGSYPVTVSASVGAGQEIGTSSFTLTPTVDQVPAFSSSPVTSVSAGKRYEYDVVASPSVAGDGLTYSLSDAPAGMSVDADGRITWATTPADQGAYAGVTVTVTDGYGVSNHQTYDLAVTAPVPDTTPPVVSVTAGSNIGAIGSPITFTVYATDDVGVTGLSLTIDGAAVTLAANDTATYTPTASGTVTAVATAVDAAGNQGTGSAAVLVLDPTSARHRPSPSIRPTTIRSLRPRPP